VLHSLLVQHRLHRRGIASRYVHMASAAFREHPATSESTFAGIAQEGTAVRRQVLGLAVDGLGMRAPAAC
jgi:hypothetical protein